LTGWQRAATGWYPGQAGTAPYPYPAPYTQMAPQEEAKTIRSQIEALEDNVKAARARLGELENNRD